MEYKAVTLMRWINSYLFNMLPAESAQIKTRVTFLSSFVYFDLESALFKFKPIVRNQCFCKLMILSNKSVELKRKKLFFSQFLKLEY